MMIFRKLMLMLAGLLVLTGCNDWRMWETPAVRPHEKPLLTMQAGTVPFSGDSEAMLKLADADTLDSPLAMNDAAVIEAGKTGYITYCAQCHGKYHDGYGTVGQSFEPIPTDLQSDRVQATGEGRMFKVISYSAPKLRQPALATTIAVEDRWKIVAYIKSLGTR